MKKKNILIYVFIASTTILMAFMGNHSSYHTRKMALPIGDTSSFASNTNGGWTIMSSYLNQETPDSVEFDVILVQNGSINWSSQQYIGTITNQKFKPRKDQKLKYDLLIFNSWTVLISASGKCYLQQLGGSNVPRSFLPNSPYVIPVNIRYRND